MIQHFKPAQKVRACVIKVGKPAQCFLYYVLSTLRIFGFDSLFRLSQIDPSTKHVSLSIKQCLPVKKPSADGATSKPIASTDKRSRSPAGTHSVNPSKSAADGARTRSPSKPSPAALPLARKRKSSGTTQDAPVSAPSSNPARSSHPTTSQAVREKIIADPAARQVKRARLSESGPSDGQNEQVFYALCSQTGRKRPFQQVVRLFMHRYRMLRLLEGLPPAWPACSYPHWAMGHRLPTLLGPQIARSR